MSSDQDRREAVLAALFDPDAPPVDTGWLREIFRVEGVQAELIEREIELERQNHSLREAQQFIESVLASISEVLVVCAPDGRVQQVNHAFTRLTGRTGAEVIGLSMTDLLDPGSRHLTTHWPELPERPSACEREVRLLDHAGRASEPVVLNCALRRDPRGDAVGLVLVGRPVGELRRAYRRLNRAHHELQQAQQRILQSEKMASLGRLVAGVAHELNNPVSFVYGNAHILRRYTHALGDYLGLVHHGVDPQVLDRQRLALGIDDILDDLPSLVDGMVEGAARIGEIIRSLRHLSLRGGQEPEPVNLAAIATTAAHWVVKGLEQRPEVELELPERLVVFGNAGQLHQVLVNLVQNAVDATAGHPHPMIRIDATSGSGHAWLRVRDNGPGLAERDLPHIFEPFYTTKDPGQGTGLGLWICYEIVEHHGGTLEAANGPDGGALFTLTLPLSG